MDLAEGTALGNYLVGGAIGAGGMAVVYHARHAVLGTEHALKLILLPKVRDRVLREGRVQAGLRHPNVVAVTDVVVFRGAPGLVLEYVNGPSLERLLSRYSSLSYPQADALAAGIFAGVGEAHRHHLVHRDLKPANILLQNEAGIWIPKIADFGLVKVAEGQKNTRTGAVMGTPSYMAPEQFRDTAGVDHRADVFAIGCVLYEVLTGQQAFPGTDLIALHTATSHRGYRPLRALRPDVPLPMEVAIEAALAPDPEHRPLDVSVLAALWFGERVAPDPRQVWPAAWLDEPWATQSTNPTPLLRTWDEFTAETDSADRSWKPGPSPMLLSPIAQSPTPQSTLDTSVEERQLRPARWPWVLAFFAVLGIGAGGASGVAWVLAGGVGESGEGSSILGLHPSDRLTGATMGRSAPLALVVGPLRPVGVAGAHAAAVDAQLVGRLGSVQGLQVSVGPADGSPSGEGSAAAARRVGAAAAIRGAVGRRGELTLLGLERIDSAGGRIAARTFAVIPPGDDLGDAVEIQVARLLSRDPAGVDADALSQELSTRKAELATCGAGEVVWSLDPSGGATVVRASDSLAACATERMASWLLPGGNASEFRWVFEP